MLSQLRRCHGLDSLELKALSVPSSLRFLLGIEYDVVLCVTETGSRRPFTLQFPVFAETFRKLLSLCAMRFSLECRHHEDGSSELHGTAEMPLLRYADYLPGALHVGEVLDCLQVTPSTKPKRKEGTSDEDAQFVASFLDYSEFTSDASLTDVHGLGFYLTLDYGLSLASHGHLVDISFHDDWAPEEAVREFQEFSGWRSFDLRFYNEHNHREGGVIVFPTIQDVYDLFERYEDEDSDDEGDLLPFILRPVAPLITVPSLEDSVLRKQRQQNWTKIVSFWERFPRTRNTVVVYNLFDGATLPEILAFMGDLPVEKSCLHEDQSPERRRRAFLTFADADSAKKALELDGKSSRGKTLRVQVAPPYINEQRRGAEVKPAPPPATQTKHGRGGDAHANGARGSSSPAQAPAERDGQKKAHADERRSAGRGAAAPPPIAAPASVDAPRPVAAGVAATGGGGSSGSAKALEAAWATATHSLARATAAGGAGAAADRNHLNIPLPASAAAAAAAGAGSGAARSGAASATHSVSNSPSMMNAGAKEFVPTFRLNANSPEFRPEAPPAYVDPAARISGAGEDLPPPPPPSYGIAVSPSVEFVPGPPRPRSVTASASLAYAEDTGAAPPLYALPPPYQEVSAVPAGAAAMPILPVFVMPPSEALYMAGGVPPPPPPPPPPPYQGN